MSKKQQKNMDINQTSILVLGMHRSGTSALTGVLGQLGVYLGSDLMGANYGNEKGYFENNKLYRINEALLSQVHSSWDDVFFDKTKLEHITDTADLGEAIKSEFEYAKLFAIKDPRLAYLFPIYERVLGDLGCDIKVILPYRNPIEVAQSLHKRNAMPLHKGMLLWAYHFLLAEKFSRGYDRVFVAFDELLSNTPKVVGDISTHLHIDLVSKYEASGDDIATFLEPSLKHHNISMDNLSSNTPKIVTDVLALKERFNTSDLSAEFDTLRSELFSYQKLFYNVSIINALDEGKSTKEALHVKTQEAEQTKQALHVKNEELNKTKQALHVKNEELNKTKESLQIKTQEHEQTKQALHVKNEELNKTKQALQIKTQEHEQTKQALHVKNEELNKTKQALQIKTQEHEQTKQALHVKNEELNKTKHALQGKNEELFKLQVELAGIYMSKSWRITRPLRNIMRKLRK